MWFLHDMVFQLCGNHASLSEGQFGYWDPRDAEGFLSCRIRCRYNSHDHHRASLHILYANSCSLGIRIVQKEKGASHDVSGDCGIRSVRGTDVPQKVF